MAAIDKTYGTKADSEQVYNWLKRHRPKMLRRHYGVDSYDHLPPEAERPIINTSVSDDKWMARFCPIPLVLRRIVEVYNQNHVASVWAAKRLTAIRTIARGEG